MSGGRPSVYKPEYAEIARDCCAAGATNETLVERFAVSRRTIDRWIEGIPDFRDAVSDGRGIANGKGVSALFASATGMEHKMVKVFAENRPLANDKDVLDFSDLEEAVWRGMPATPPQIRAEMTPMLLPQASPSDSTSICEPGRVLAVNPAVRASGAGDLSGSFR